MRSTRIISFFLVLVMLCTTVFVACGETPEETTAETSAETTALSTSETTDKIDETEESETTDTSRPETSVATETETEEITTEESSETEEISTEESTEVTTNTEEETTETESITESETETKEETTVITDVMIGETLEAEYAADFSVAKIFSNDMVVQRNEHIRVWGFAPESENGKKVSGEFKGMFAEALIENGEWCIKFGARLEADTVGAEMKIYAGENKTVTFTGVLVGDVYLVMGQSNAAYDVNSHLTYTDPATQGGGAAAIDPNSIIRLNHLNGSGGAYNKKGTDYVYPDLENTKYWTKTTLSNTAPFSAIGYYFARAMVEKSDNTVPVGLIEVARGGAPLISFLPNELADLYKGDYYDPLSDKYYSTISTEHMGRYLYNCYLAPVSRYAIAGVVWYQGESNNSRQNAMNYCKEFNGFVEYLRSTHNVINKDFPVFVAEFPSIYTQPANYSGAAPWYYMEVGIIRSYMGLLPTTVKNCYVGASSDLWNDRNFSNNLHPNCKYEQAGRLADLAEVVIFGKGDMNEAGGPIFKNAEFSEDKKTVYLNFINVGEGLTTADGGDAVKGLVGLVAKDFIYTQVEPVSATIVDKDTVVVVFDEAVKAVAYNYITTDYFGETLNLCNSAGIPSLAFITPFEEKPLDDFKSEDFVKDSISAVKKRGESIDTLRADGLELFPMGGIEGQLQAANNTVSIPEGTSVIGAAGWIGFRYYIIMFGYSIDGGDAIFDTYPIEPEQAVKDAGGEYAKRFNVNMYLNNLSLGEHTVTFLALIDLKGGTAVSFLSFKVNVVEKEEAPKGLDVPMAGDTGYTFKASSYDRFLVDDTELFNGIVNEKLNAARNTVTVSQNASTLAFTGWISFESEITSFGYSINGTEPLLNSEPIAPEDAVVDIGGELARRFCIIADISSLEVGQHAFDFLIELNTASGETVLRLLSFTLVVTE